VTGLKDIVGQHVDVWLPTYGVVCPQQPASLLAEWWQDVGISWAGRPFVVLAKTEASTPATQEAGGDAP